MSYVRRITNLTDSQQIQLSIVFTFLHQLGSIYEYIQVKSTIISLLKDLFLVVKAILEETNFLDVPANVNIISYTYIASWN